MVNDLITVLTTASGVSIVELSALFIIIYISAKPVKWLINLLFGGV